MTATIYLDHHATTPLDPRVREAMAPYWGERFGNPHSSSHRVGWAAAAAVDEARAAVATLIGADPAEIVFTSGATEANNLALRGTLAEPGAGLAITAIEHASVRETAADLARAGHPLATLPVEPDGRFDPASLEASAGADTRLVSVILANNEIGVVQPLAEIAGICRDRALLLHSDAAQAAGKLPLDVRDLGVDLLSLSAHKLHGPMGIGALYVRRGLALRPQITGGAQQGGRRAGTLPTPLCVGFGAACRLAAAELIAEMQRLTHLRDHLAELLIAAIPGLRINGSRTHRLPGNLNISVAGIDAEDWLAAMPELAVSSGAACASASREPSHVLQAIGLTPEEIQGSLRFGLGRFTSEAEVERAVEVVLDGLGRISRGRFAGATASPTRA